MKLRFGQERIVIKMNLLLLIMIFSIVFISTTLIAWSIHISQTNGWTNVSGYGNYKNFKIEFNKYSWDSENYIWDGLWDRKNDCELFASIYKFNGIGMKMITPWDYLFTIIFIRKHKNSLSKKHKYDWDKNNKQTYNTDNIIKNSVNELKAEELAKQAWEALKKDFPDIRYKTVFESIKKKM